MAATLVLLHGFTHTGRSWDPVIAALDERYLALAPDIRGHGQAGDRQPVSLAAVIDDLASVPSPRFTLAGYSMGGRIALHVALTLPSRVQRLVLIGASPGIADPSEREARRRADAQLADETESEAIEQFARKWATTAVLGAQPPEVQAATYADRLRSTPSGLSRALRGLGAGALPPLWDRLGELAMPVTLVVGERDEKFRAIAAQMAQAIPAAEIIVVPHSGHAVHLEAPDAVAGVLRESR
jgi:2-succinyl-6-hydroxy-2,4-cyclohexadiene-1-carboxylate synthase